MIVSAGGGTGARPHPLTLVRAERGWTYQALARLLARRANDVGVNMAAERQKPWRWEHSNVTPDWITQQLLADELGVPREAICRRPWPAWLPVRSRMSYQQIMDHLADEIEKGLQALADLGYGPGVPDYDRGYDRDYDQRT